MTTEICSLLVNPRSLGTNWLITPIFGYHRQFVVVASGQLIDIAVCVGSLNLVRSVAKLFS